MRGISFELLQINPEQDQAEEAAATETSRLLQCLMAIVKKLTTNNSNVGVSKRTTMTQFTPVQFKQSHQLKDSYYGW